MLNKFTKSFGHSQSIWRSVKRQLDKCHQNWVTFPCHIISKTKTPEQISSSGVALSLRHIANHRSKYARHTCGAEISDAPWAV